jgi:hypothetical protein
VNEEISFKLEHFILAKPAITVRNTKYEIR